MHGMEHRNIRFFGEVQGVGFRATSLRIAQSLDLEGWVANCPDGSVEVDVEANPDQLDLLVRRIRDSVPGRGITRENIVSGPALGTGGRGFHIRRLWC
jgi:acylphosphatase